MLKAAADGAVSLVAQFDGEPSGLKIAIDGTIWITDKRLGLVTVDPAGGTVTPVVVSPEDGRFGAAVDAGRDRRLGRVSRRRVP